MDETICIVSKLQREAAGLNNNKILIEWKPTLCLRCRIISNSQEMKKLRKNSRTEVRPKRDHTEKLMFTDKMWKFNRYDWKQERNFVISNLAIYNYKKKRRGLFSSREQAAHRYR